MSAFVTAFIFEPTNGYSWENLEDFAAENVSPLGRLELQAFGFADCSNHLTHRGWDKMAAISQTKFSSAIF